MTILASDIFAFRAGTMQDAALLADLGWRMFGEAIGAANSPEDMAAFRPTLYSSELQAAELADPDTEFSIAVAAGEAVAYIKLRSAHAPEAIQSSRPLRIDRFYIAQQWTGQDLGDKLMQLCLEKAQQQEHDVVWLTVWERNSRAIRFYQKYGFREVGELAFVLGQDV